MHVMYVWYVCIISARALDAWRRCQVLIGGVRGVSPRYYKSCQNLGSNDPVATDVLGYLCMYCM